MKYIAILFILAKISIFDIYNVPGVSMEPAFMHNSAVLVNKMAFGLHLPFFVETMLDWSTPRKNDVVIIHTKHNKNQIKRVLGVPREVLIINGKRFVVPDSFVLVGVDNAKISLYNKDFGLISVKNILGKCVFMIQ